MFAEPPRTPYDLNFPLFGFRVRVHPLLLARGGTPRGESPGRGVQYLLIWIAVVFVSILVHELGHAIVFRGFGTNSHIVLWMFGGLAVPYASVGQHMEADCGLAGGAGCRFHSLWPCLWLTQTLALGSTREWASRLLSLLPPCSQ